MKRLDDFFATNYFLLIVCLLIAFTDEVIVATKAHPLLMGFAKFAVLATFGEYLKVRLRTGVWEVSHPCQRFITWGFFGVWIALIFPFVGAGVDGLTAKDMWFSGSVWWTCFSKSFWLQFLSGFAWTMMVFHEYINFVIQEQKFISPVEFGERLDKKVWFKTIPLSILLFWLPVHAVNFMLPEHFRVLVAAFLSIVLGFILTIGHKK